MVVGDFNYTYLTWNEDGNGKTRMGSKECEDKFVD